MKLQPGRVASPDLPDLDESSAEEILEWALGEYFPDIGLACSMQDAVVVDLAVKIQPAVEVFFLETQFHFPETLETAKNLKERYNLNLVELRPVENPAVYFKDGYEACCASRKVGPLNRYLEDKKAWVSGVRRTDSPQRAKARAAEWDAGRGLVKINPIFAWTDDQLDRYIADNDLIVNPLAAKGYESIGCWPCTEPGKGRQGRWVGMEKTECGLHLSGPPLGRPPETGPHPPIASPAAPQ